jgi:hypothetical protein
MPLVEHDDISNMSLRQLPTKHSATPFCHGLRKLVRFGSMPKLLMVLTTSSLKFVARSKIRYFTVEIIWKGLTQLLRDPGASRMASNGLFCALNLGRGCRVVSVASCCRRAKFSNNRFRPEAHNTSQEFEEKPQRSEHELLVARNCICRSSPRLPLRARLLPESRSAFCPKPQISVFGYNFGEAQAHLPVSLPCRSHIAPASPGPSIYS